MNYIHVIIITSLLFLLSGCATLNLTVVTDRKEVAKNPHEVCVDAGELNTLIEEYERLKQNEGKREI